MRWETETPEVPKITHRMTSAGVSVSVGPSCANDQNWCYISLSLGQHSPQTEEFLRDWWPREAIALARAALDAFERELDQCPTE